MDGTCRKHGRDRNCIRHFYLKVSDPLKKLEDDIKMDVQMLCWNFDRSNGFHMLHVLKDLFLQTAPFSL
jgi:hypothetical protein